MTTCTLKKTNEKKKTLTSADYTDTGYLQVTVSTSGGSHLSKLINLPVSSSLMMSSRRFVPPVVAITLTPPMCLLTWIHIWLTCRASSLVGTMTKAEQRRNVHTTRFN